MIIHWPAFLCWVTQSPSPQSLKTSTRTTSSNCISSPTSTISDRRVNTLLRGTESNLPVAHVLNVFAVFLSPGCQRTDKEPLSAHRWMEVIRSATVPSGGARVLNSKESHPHWVRLTLFPRLPRVASALPVPLDSLLFFSTHIWDICTCVHAHLVLFNALMVTCPLV